MFERAFFFFFFLCHPNGLAEACAETQRGTAKGDAGAGTAGRTLKNCRTSASAPAVDVMEKRMLTLRTDGALSMLELSACGASLAMSMLRHTQVLQLKNLFMNNFWNDKGLSTKQKVIAMVRHTPVKASAYVTNQ